MPKSYKHSNEKRAHIPSKEEAGYETGNPVVQEKLEKPILRNPITERGADPELFWLNKYGTQDDETHSLVDIRSLYRVEHVSPELLIKRFYRNTPPAIRDLFGNSLEMDELDKPMSYYSHQDDWQNRLIQGDSLLVMSSLLEREGMAGKVQMIYIDPPYGIKYGSNWQIKLNDRNVKDGDDDALSGEPEQIRAFRDTWELGIHSYLSYLRDRLIVARELLSESGSCFVQISDENVHLVRCLMDEVFGSGNFVSLITFSKGVSLGASGLPSICNFIIWYAKSKDVYKYRQLFSEKEIGVDTPYTMLLLPDGRFRTMTKEEKSEPNMIPKEYEIFRFDKLTSAGYTATCFYDFDLNGEIIKSGKYSWKTNKAGMEKLKKKNRVVKQGNTAAYVLKYSDFPVIPIRNLWTNMQGANNPIYVVQTNTEVVKRCLLMTTDPGDLVLDPTCGSGTTAYVAEQWGRRWITIDTSRIAINIAKTRLMTASYDYYKLKNDRDLTEGFIYKTVPHVTLKSLANDEPPDTETLYDQPEIDRKVIRIAGEFTVETLQSYEPVLPTELVKQSESDGREHFESLIFDHLKTAGVKNSLKDETAKFIRVESLAHAYLHAEGFYHTYQGERKAYVHIGDKFSAVSKRAVNEAIKECRTRGDADWLIILGFAFESDISNQKVTQNVGSFEVTKVRMHDDLLQEGLRKKDKKAGSFITIGEIEAKIYKNADNTVQVEICGLDIYDPIKDEVRPRDLHHIAYWMLDDDYDGSNFIVKQIFFCGGDKQEFKNWKKGLENLAVGKTRKNVQNTLKIEIEEEAFERIYGYKSHPITVKPGQKIAIKAISHFGEESFKIIGDLS